MTKKLVSKVRVKNRLGLHTRPATAIVKLLQNFKSDVHFTHKRETVNAKSILSILMLAARKNSSITITVDGEDAESTLESLVNAFENEFEEKDQKSF
ncbi:MAG: HPr family phosphocarrier protein [Chlamydiales bacterium]